MPGIHLVSDSSCDLAPDEIVGLNIEIVPLSIRFGNDEFIDQQNLTVDEFYDKMADSDVPPDSLPITRCI